MKKHISLLFLTVLAALPSTASHYPDSVQTASRGERRIEYGWNFEFYGGIGTGRFENKQIGDGYTAGHSDPQLVFPTWNAGIGINYYFVPWMGIGTGAEYHSYANTSAVVRPWTVRGVDRQNDAYILSSTPHGIREHERLNMLEIPIGFKFRAIPKKAGFTGSIGVKLGLPINNYYHMDQSGYLRNEVYYEHWDLLIADVPGVIEDAAMQERIGSVPSESFNRLNYAGYAEAGVLIQLSQRVDLAVSLFGTYYINNVLSQPSSKALSFASYYPSGEYPAPFRGSYAGILATSEFKELHPWSAGLKVGIHVNANRTRAQREYDRSQRASAYEWTVPAVEAPDTTGQYEREQAARRAAAIEEIKRIAAENQIDLGSEFCEPAVVIVRDTIYLAERTERTETTNAVAAALDEMLSRSVIFFHLDDTVPVLEPANLLDRIAEILVRHPEQKIHIDGHACRLGSKSYNQRLAQRRAEAVAQRLLGQGVRPEQLQVRSLGSSHPFHYQGKHQLSKDRRVEIVPSETGDEETEVVIPGSRLAQIARRHYGVPQYWVFIYEANHEKLSSNPNELPAGVELVIPDLSKRFPGRSKEQIAEEAKKLESELKGYIH